MSAYVKTLKDENNNTIYPQTTVNAIIGDISPKIEVNGLVKGDGTGLVLAAVPGVDYVLPGGNISGNAATATRVSNSLTFGSKTFNGSSAQTITAADLGALTAHQNISGKENTSNKVSTITSSSTDTQYPTAKCLYDNLKNAQIPIATIIPFAGSTVPSGWLECNGAAVSRNVYSQLYATIGTTYGTGDGSTTFNLPDLQGRMPQGEGILGDETYTLGQTKNAGLPNITGSVYGDDVSRDCAVTCTGAFQFGGGIGHFGAATTYNLTNGFTFNASRSSAVYGASTTVQPPTTIIKYIIKATNTPIIEPASPTIEQRLAAIETQLSTQLNIFTNAHSYSTSEMKIGTWLDGKPLYRKYVDYGILPSATAAERAHGIANVQHIHINQGETFWTTSSGSYTDNNGWTYIQPYTGGYVDSMAVNKTNIHVGTSTSSASSYHLIVCLEYTKTTD